MDNESTEKVGTVWKKKFFVALLAGFLALGGLISVFGFTGTAFALPLGGIGDFYVKFDKLEGKGFQLMPKIGETGNSDAEPMIRNKIEEVKIDNLHIYKDIKLPTDQWIRINIKALGPTKISGLIQDARLIDANLSFNELAIEEQNTSDFSKNWSQNAQTITITNAKLVTDYLFQSVVSLGNAKIYVEKIDSPDRTNIN
ncbi:DUF6230 family protein [Aquibacillus sp. 3ASR75-11]|uniref:DUF6230 family protein n=1 Tax=Terrihalobacillus insolitus TaxID=2950438 RepID=A0A9X3WVU3_9BACI|nr:DUF6230 family protein [Terrihalobacillus insolitus]MDC3414565.1 DUF6230 family protein [Terrihalobacillus insolitus]MDC3425758.1 DUF6230 family protein [Terrihalobacillus insolitus]